MGGKQCGVFVMCLYKLVHKHLQRKKPEFVNVDEE